MLSTESAITKNIPFTVQVASVKRQTDQNRVCLSGGRHKLRCSVIRIVLQHASALKADAKKHVCHWFVRVLPSRSHFTGRLVRGGPGIPAWWESRGILSEVSFHFRRAAFLLAPAMHLQLGESDASNLLLPSSPAMHLLRGIFDGLSSLSCRIFLLSSALTKLSPSERFANWTGPAPHVWSAYCDSPKGAVWAHSYTKVAYLHTQLNI